MIPLIRQLMVTGFNVDRILNQQREERLRVQAEAGRDREKAAAGVQDGRATIRDDQSTTSDASMSQSSTAVETDSGPKSKTRSLLDKLKRRSSRESKSGPGVFPQLGDKSPVDLAGALAHFSGMNGSSGSDGGVRGPAGNGPGVNTTKRVSF